MRLSPGQTELRSVHLLVSPAAWPANTAAVPSGPPDCSLSPSLLPGFNSCLLCLYVLTISTFQNSALASRRNCLTCIILTNRLSLKALNLSNTWEKWMRKKCDPFNPLPCRHWLQLFRNVHDCALLSHTVLTYLPFSSVSSLNGLFSTFHHSEN